MSVLTCVCRNLGSQGCSRLKFAVQSLGGWVFLCSIDISCHGIDDHRRGFLFVFFSTITAVILVDSFCLGSLDWNGVIRASSALLVAIIMEASVEGGKELGAWTEQRA